MADVILKTEEKKDVEKIKQLLETLNEDQRKHMLTTLEGVKLGLQLAKHQEEKEPVA